ncbi:MAG: hypothetical protein RLZ75_2971, partial [Pseudomonadota bacterium]
CLHALENSKSRGSLPDAEDIINDPDMDTVKNQPWFIEFMATLNKKSEAVVVEAAEIITETIA